MENDSKLVTLVIGLIAGIYGWLLRHVTSGKHPTKEAIVYKDVCESERKGIGDCIEGAIRRSDEQHKSVMDQINQRFEAQEKLFRSCTDNLKNLITTYQKENQRSHR